MEKKTLKQLLERRIVVPEIQREYVWGADDDIISSFLASLCSDSGMSRTVGFLYAYERSGSTPDVVTDHEVFLIDGQQRFTTLTLIAMALAMNEGAASYAEFGSDYRVGSPLPSFSFRVRSLTEQFLGSLMLAVCKGHVISDGKGIKDQTWYVSDYDDDTSIQNMIRAWTTINACIRSVSLSYADVMEVEFWYFLTSQTSQGEELYITMNSRGEVPTPSEHIKPVLLERSDNPEAYGKKWDDWEEWIYEQVFEHNPDADNRKLLQHVDDCMDTLLKIVAEFNTQRTQRSITAADAELMCVGDVERFVKAMQLVHGLCPDLIRPFFVPGKSPMPEIKAALAVGMKGCLPDVTTELRRVNHAVVNGRRRSTISDNEAFQQFICSYAESDLPFYAFVEQYDEGSKALFTAHERHKFMLMARTGSIRLEELIWEAQAHNILYGNLRCLWPELFRQPADKIKSVAPLTEAQIDELSDRFKAFSTIFDSRIVNHELSAAPAPDYISNSLISRALLAQNPNYEGIEIRYGTQYCFGYGEEWRKIVNRTNYLDAVDGLISLAMPQLGAGESAIAGAIESMIQSAADDSIRDTRYYILRYPYSLQPEYHGNNYLYWEGGWDNFKVAVMGFRSLRGKGYAVNMFTNLVYHTLKANVDNLYSEDTIAVGPFLLDKSKGIQIEIHQQGHHGWTIFTTDGHKLPDTLAEQFNAYNPVYDESHTRCSIEVAPAHDLIIVGCTLASIITGHI